MRQGADIAIVDDDPGVRAALEDLVRSLGHAPQAYGSADAFLADPARPRFRCLILDIRMPGLNGLDLQDVLARERDPVPVIILSSYVDAAIRARAEAAGAHCVFTKPVDAAALIRCLEDAVAVTD